MGLNMPVQEFLALACFFTLLFDKWSMSFLMAGYQ
jgi:hypothetical protein